MTDTETQTPAAAWSYTTGAGKTYYLHSRTTVAGSGKKVVFYYFSKTVKPDHAVAAFPDGYVVSESNHMPILRMAPAEPAA